ncbi:mxaD protein [Xanthobacter sp. SG618]|uniref:SRPBCC family protein n=1 Tax=Xanthobacter sp. SG618 TaxID=2587121 RepID=UPI00145C55DF|nr:SRPBCC family protein [Xanthobacter sp. SG618]NMN58681.1 mxaD protein [Xanthobacter sp. SG618]
MIFACLSRRALLSSLGVFLALAAPAQAHGPTPQKAEAKATIAATPDAVWKIAGDFAGIGGWHPMVKAVRAKGGNAAGAERVLVLEKGEITDGLDDVDAAQRSLSWRLNTENVEALPVSFYTITLSVNDAGGGKSEVVMAGRFYRGDTSNFPPDELNDEAAVAAMTAFFEAGVNGLKAKAEGK